MTEAITKDLKLDGLVLYSDGSCKPNPGFLGFGIHGYAYTKSEPKKGAGNPKYVLSENGYVEKSLPCKAQVTPHYYFDSIGSVSYQGSNNTAEVLATNSAIEYAIQWPAQKVLIKTDSNYVVKGINEWSYHWVKNRWIKRDGAPVPNKEEWQTLLHNVARLKETGTKLEVRWVEGHSTHLGNNLADKLANIGCEVSKTGKAVVQTNASPSEGYWKPQEERHALLAYPAMYFSTSGKSFIKGEYYLGKAAKSDEIIGIRDSDGAYAVIQLKEPEPVLEMIRNKQAALSDNIDSMVLARVDRIYSGTKADDLMRYGEHCLSYANRKTINLNFITDKDTSEPLTEQLFPPLLAMRTMTAIAEIKELLEVIKENNPEELTKRKLTTFDITSHFFETKEKKQGKNIVTVHELKKEFVATLLKTSINVEVDGKPVDFDLTFGIDIIPRNNLKRISEGHIKITLVVVRESDQALRYHTVIHSGEDWSIWSGYYTNLVITPEKK